MAKLKDAFRKAGSIRGKTPQAAQDEARGKKRKMGDSERKPRRRGGSARTPMRDNQL